MTTTIEKKGRRFHLVGLPFDARNLAKEAGCKWDPDARLWWTGKQDVAERVAAAATQRVSAQQDEGISTSAKVITGRAEYEGKQYYLLASGVSQRTGQFYAKLAYRDGSRAFWAKDAAAVKVIRIYREKTSIDSLRAYAERRKAEDRGEVECPVCARYCTCGTSFCTHHHDGCDRCGAEH